MSNDNSISARLRCFGTLHYIPRDE